MLKEFEDRLNKIEAALEKAVTMNFSEEWKTASFGNLPAAIKTKHIQNLIEPNKNLIDLGGKRWRPLLQILCAELAAQNNKCELTEEQLYSLVPMVEFVHTASLIHDDIEDNADYRRGKPAAHITYGLDTALNAAAWLYFEAPVCLNSKDISAEMSLKLYRLYTTELRRLHLGQAMDIYWHREKGLFPEIEEYKAMVKNKTGTLASLAAKAGIMAGGGSAQQVEEIGSTAANIGIGFQIIDDVINLTTGNPGKKRGDDIVEGKKSLPVLLHIQKKTEDKEIISKLMEQAAKEGIDSPAVEKCIAVLETSGCIQEAAAQGKNLIQENCQLIGNYYKNGKEISDLIVTLFNSMIPEAFR
ncbi:MAG: polyprenyl synthetase family protein [Treponema sp.]|nr:polyprenyl synthetase family protein [Treponema sp.]